MTASESHSSDVRLAERKDGYIGLAAWPICYATNWGFGVCSERAASGASTRSASRLQGARRVPDTGRARPERAPRLEAASALACSRCAAAARGFVVQWLTSGSMAGPCAAGAELVPRFLNVLISLFSKTVLSLQSACAVGGLVGFSNAKLGSSKTRWERSTSISCCHRLIILQFLMF